MLWLLGGGGDREGSFQGFTRDAHPTALPPRDRDLKHMYDKSMFLVQGRLNRAGKPFFCRPISDCRNDSTTSRLRSGHSPVAGEDVDLRVRRRSCTAGRWVGGWDCQTLRRWAFRSGSRVEPILALSASAKASSSSSCGIDWRPHDLRANEEGGWWLGILRWGLLVLRRTVSHGRDLVEQRRLGGSETTECVGWFTWGMLPSYWAITVGGDATQRGISRGASSGRSSRPADSYSFFLHPHTSPAPTPTRKCPIRRQKTRDHPSAAESPN